VLGRGITVPNLPKIKPKYPATKRWRKDKRASFAEIDLQATVLML
jgi:hypothetical protein